MIIPSRSTGAMLGFLGQEHWWSEEGRQSSRVRAFLVLKTCAQTSVFRMPKRLGSKMEEQLP